NTDPFECQGPHSGLMGFTLLALLVVVDLCPEGMPDRFRCPLHERLSEALWTLEAPVHPGRLAAACGDWGNARIFLQFGGRGIARVLVATGDEEAGSADRPSAWEGLEEGEVGMGLGPLRDGGGEGCDGLQGDAELGSGCTNRVLGAMTPSSVVNGVAVLMARRRCAITSAEGPWWSRQKVSRVVRRARWAALRVGQRRRKSQNMGVSLS